MVAFIPQPHGSLEQDNQAFLRVPLGEEPGVLDGQSYFQYNPFPFLICCSLITKYKEVLVSLQALQALEG